MKSIGSVLRTSAAAVTAYVVGLTVAGAATVTAQTSNESSRPKPTIVLVHGANADSSSWGGVIKRLQKDRYPDIIEDIRGKGLLIGVKVKPNNRAVMAMARDQGLLIAGGGDNCVRLLPPLNFTMHEAREAIERFERTCEAARAEAQAA